MITEKKETVKGTLTRGEKRRGHSIHQKGGSVCGGGFCQKKSFVFPAWGWVFKRQQQKLTTSSRARWTHHGPLIVQTFKDSASVAIAERPQVKRFTDHGTKSDQRGGPTVSNPIRGKTGKMTGVGYAPREGGHNHNGGGQGLRPVACAVFSPQNGQKQDPPCGGWGE